MMRQIRMNPLKTLALLAALAATPACAEMKIEIPFSARIAGRPFACGASHADMGRTKSTVQVADFRHNVSNFRLIGADGAEVPVPPGGAGIAAFSLRSEDLGRFRAPSLRNVAGTGPHMHDGSIATLPEVLDTYARGGRFPDAAQKDPLVAGFHRTAQEKAEVIACLESLTDPDFLTNLAFADPWPAGHPAVHTRVMP